MGGLRPGEVTVVAGRPSMGKTAFCWSLAENIKNSGKSVRVIAQQRGYIGSFCPIIVDTYDYDNNLQPFDDVTYTIGVQQATGENYDVLIFTALLPVGSAEVEKLFRKLKSFAAEENIAVVVEAMVSKSVERGNTRRPELKHLYFSKSILKYADNILVVYRDAYYRAEADGSVFEVIVAKNSIGSCGTAVLKFEVNEVQTTVYVPRIK